MLFDLLLLLLNPPLKKNIKQRAFSAVSEVWTHSAHAYTYIFPLPEFMRPCSRRTDCGVELKVCCYARLQVQFAFALHQLLDCSLELQLACRFRHCPGGLALNKDC